MEKKRLLKIFVGFAAIMLLTLACSLPSAGNTADGSPTETQGTAESQQVSETAAVIETETPPALTNTPTETIVPTGTFTPQPPTPTNTNTPIPCNKATFIADVTVPDNTEFLTGETFVKTWRLKNVGSCTWTSSYNLIFYSGDQMSAPAAVSLTSVNIPPNGTADVSVSLTAPSTAGTYQGYFRLRAPDNSIFGIGASAQDSFWVKIKAIEPTDTPVPSAAKPDLYVSEFTIDPATPVQGSPAHVRIGVYNQGDAAAGPFKVEWYGLTTAANASCEWDVPSMNAHGGRILECDYTFASWYPINKTTIVHVDVNNQVDESDEANNSRSITPFGVTQP